MTEAEHNRSIASLRADVEWTDQFSAGSLQYTVGPADGACQDCGSKQLIGQNSHSDVICPECGWYKSVWRWDSTTGEDV